MINPNKGKIVSVADQQDLRKLLRKFEKQKEAKPQTPKDLEYAVRLIEHYQNLQETGGHLVKLFQPGPLGIDKYTHHKAFFDATANHKQVLFRGANRAGKSQTGAYAVTCWATGLYPDWWEGRVFPKATYGWICGDTNDTVRTILQDTLLGTPHGTGMIPKKNIIDVTIRPNTGGTVDTIHVLHTPTQKVSKMKLKTYQSGPDSFYGKACDYCVAHDSLVQMADGSVKAIQDVAPGDEVVSLNQAGKYTTRKVTRVVCNGKQPVIDVALRKGTWIRCTPDHEIFYSTKYKNKTEAINAESALLMIPGTFVPTVTEDRESAWYVWAALYVSEGCYSQRKITNGSIEQMQEAIALLPATARCRQQSFNSDHVDDWYVYWDEFWEEMPEGLSDTKRIPEFVFKSSRQKIAEFIGWMFFGDGWVDKKGKFNYATTSRRLADELIVLLNRLGIRASMTRRPQKGNWKEQWWVGISSCESAMLFHETIRIPGKENNAQIAYESAVQRKKNCQSRLGKEPNGIVLQNQNKRYKEMHASVTGVREVGEDFVYDISVEDDHRFYCGTALVSNCWLDEEPGGAAAPLIWNQCYTRLLTTKGNMIVTFTPLMGWTPILRDYCETATDLTPPDEQYNFKE